MMKKTIKFLVKVVIVISIAELISYSSYKLGYDNGYKQGVSNSLEQIQTINNSENGK